MRPPDELDEEPAALGEAVAHRPQEEGSRIAEGYTGRQRARWTLGNRQGPDWFPWAGRGEVGKRAWDWQE